MMAEASSMETEGVSTQQETFRKSTNAIDLKEKGNKALSEERYEEAVKYYTQAIELDPDNHVLYSNRSATHAHLQEYQLSLKDAEKTIELNPDWAKGYSRKGTALFYLEQYEQAKEAYNKGLEYDPENETMKKELENCNQKLKSPALSQPLANPFAMPGVEEKLRNDDRTKKLMEEEAYQQLIEQLKTDPISLGNKLESPEVLNILSVLLGLDIKLPGGNDDENEGINKDEKKQYAADADVKEGSEKQGQEDPETEDQDSTKDLEQKDDDSDSETEENDFDSVIEKEKEDEDMYGKSPQQADRPLPSQVRDHGITGSFKQDVTSAPSSLRSTVEEEQSEVRDEDVHSADTKEVSAASNTKDGDGLDDDQMTHVISEEPVNDEDSDNDSGHDEEEQSSVIQVCSDEKKESSDQEEDKIEEEDKTEEDDKIEEEEDETEEDDKIEEEEEKKIEEDKTEDIQEQQSEEECYIEDEQDKCESDKDVKDDDSIPDRISSSAAPVQEEEHQSNDENSGSSV
ncbi:uncharacterized protein [Antedon mediterranea]|uniref:uncharacterized protein n=1 Tax=Antedon mediterranea TaxID=105859 RepID=UPI003AF84D25